MNSGKISPILFVVLGVALGLFGFFIILANPFGWKLPFPSLIKIPNQTSQTVPKDMISAPTPYLFLPTGKQTYNARGADSKKSSVTSITFDPLDPKINTNQTITVTAVSSEAINSLTVTVNTDTQSTPHKMNLVSGDNLKGEWSTTFKVTDSYEKVYNVSFEIITQLGNKTTQPMPIR